MSYSDFTLKRVKDEFGLNVIEDKDLFSKIPETQISESLSTTLSYNVPLAMAVGTEKAMQETFGSSCHGAGRNLSRTKAFKDAKGRNLLDELNKRGVVIQASGYKTIAEEMPDAYKDVSEVVNVMHEEGITRKVAKLKPIGVIKG